ncbi:MAG: hypothetical protein MPL62_17135, partial [Alphaproteobacteria bacterium]|nr:hypothetical protein [Alphaproteobacteria bacterium]
VSPAYRVLSPVDDYVTAVQSDPYAHRMRVALFWSAASLLYIFGGLEMKGLALVNVENVTHENFRIFLFIMTAYYALMFLFVFAKVWAVHHPVSLFSELRQYRKGFYLSRSSIGYDFRRWTRYSQRPLGSAARQHAPKMPTLKSEKEVFHFMANWMFVGMLENLFARMFFPMLVCGTALWVLVREVFF